MFYEYKSLLKFYIDSAIKQNKEEFKMNVETIRREVGEILDMKENLDKLRTKAEKSLESEDYKKHDYFTDKVQECNLKLRDSAQRFVRNCESILSFDGEDDLGEHWTLQKILKITEIVKIGIENKAREDLYVPETNNDYYKIFAFRIIQGINTRFAMIVEFPWNEGYTHCELAEIVDNIFEAGKWISNHSRSHQRDMVIKPRCVGESWVSGAKK